MSKQYLYHYGLNKHSVLKSIAMQRNIVTRNKMSYDNNISFFTQPLPTQLGSLFNGRNKHWVKGMVYYQHVVDVDGIPDNISYHLVESPQKTDLIINKQDWDKAEKDHSLQQEYLNQIRSMEIANGYIGDTKSDMLNAIATIDKPLIDYYKQSIKYGLHEVFELYAALVPHLMLFPTKPLKPVSVDKIIIQ